MDAKEKRAHVEQVTKDTLRFYGVLMDLLSIDDSIEAEGVMDGYKYTLVIKREKL